MRSANNLRSFEFKRRIDDTVYRFHPCEPLHGQSAWKREDLDVWITLVNGHGWVCVNAEFEILGVPWAVALATQGSMPPAGIWVSRKGDKSYVYELVYL
ncbi:hypothetical protein [Nostoc sp. FACHB-280]|uniref:hypothetical protein n=1 Tax=Nostoc sp. FACHB-280 TaxID=2692839 RepID=UPI00168B53CF|nr:hypothetical protein [Nostoc sp. FACHB-280]MBD2493886.1 hypothetical protein [Nostoc sp. FACHB-280]